jgi:RNA recognition motif. (a.k.a. RRM, RBD, or RNP domain)
MADDLDSFFDEVEEVATTALTTADDQEEEPPTKKRKVEHVRPRGVVVAAASSVSKPLVKEQYPVDNATAQQRRVPPPPPPLPVGQTVGPASIPPPPPSQDAKKKPHIRTTAGKTWVDATLADWPDDDFRLFVGNLDPAVTDAQLYQHFVKYASLNQVRVIRDNKTGNSSGYGFVSLQNALECAAAIREQDQTWLGGRPIRIKRSHWKDRELKERKKKEQQQKRKQRML